MVFLMGPGTVSDTIRARENERLNLKGTKRERSGRMDHGWKSERKSTVLHLKCSAGKFNFRRLRLLGVIMGEIIHLGAPKRVRLRIHDITPLVVPSRLSQRSVKLFRRKFRKHNFVWFKSLHLAQP